MTLSPRLWGIIAGALVLAGLVIALLTTRATLADTKRDLVTAQVKLSVSNASINRLTEQLDRVMAEQRGLEQSDASRKQASREAIALADAASEYRKAAIERLQVSAGRLQPDQDCEVSDAVLAVWP